MFKTISIYFAPNILKIFLYGLINGMNLLLSGNSLNFWLAESNIDIKILGFFAFIALPYGFKYFIAIFINNNKIIGLSNRIGIHKSWLIISQLMLTIALAILSFLNPQENLGLIAMTSLSIALFSVIQDIILNANRINILPPSQQAEGTSIYTLGYRVGMLITGAGVISASIYMSWNNIYYILAIVYFLLTIILYYFYQDICDNTLDNKTENTNIWTSPFKSFLSVKHFIWVILFIIIYRLPDNMIGVMINPFLLELGYNALEISSISKFFGTIMIIIGGIISGPIINNLGIKKSLISFSLLHMLGHFLFIILTYLGKNILFLYFLTAYGALTDGMVMIIYIYFIGSLCKGKHTSIQYALLSSAIGISRAIFPSASGIIVDNYGWSFFFTAIVIISAFTVLFTWKAPKKLFS